MATIPDDANSIYVWSNVYTNSTLGKVADIKIAAPTVGATNPISGQANPSLSSISSIIYMPDGSVYLVDSNSGTNGSISGGLIYKLNSFNY
jgi:hypothetical protein